MSYGNIHNVLETGNKRTDRQRIEMKCQNEGDYSTLNDFRSNRQQPLQSTGHESTKIRCYRSVTVCLVLLCVLLLTAVIVLCVLINTNNQQQHNTKNELWKTLSEADGWIYYQSSLFFISSETKTWSESRKFCRERGADLIFINNSQKLNFISTHSGGDKVWIGLSDIEEEGVWKWVDGSTMTSSFWNKKEPNTSEGDEDCVLIELRGWADYPCSHDYKWICEKKFN